MGRTLIPDTMFPELVELYNSEGRTALYDLLRSKYGMKQPYFVLQRIKDSDRFEYDSESDRFTDTAGCAADDVFMDLDDLCSGQIVKNPAANDTANDLSPRKSALEQLVNELINDRLLTLNKYITMDSASRTILIDQTSLAQDGYRIISH